MTVRSCSIARVAGALGAIAALASPAPAAADVTKKACIEANTLAQASRRDGKFAAARAQLATCGDPSCPGIVRDDCAQRLDDLERIQPTLIFSAKDGDGHDLVAVQVTSDGQPFAEQLDGRPLRIDPGAHTFTFTVANQPPVSETLVVTEGEKDRRERLVIGAPTAPAPSPQTVAAVESGGPPPPPSGLGTQRVLGLVVGGGGVVGAGLGAVFGMLAASSWSSAKSACGGDPGHCANVTSADSFRTTTEGDGTISTIGFIAGGVLFATGAVLYLTGGHGNQSGQGEWRAATTVAVAPSVGGGQAGLAVVGAF